MTNKIRFILDNKTPVLFEKVIENQINKPIAYYKTLDKAIEVLKSQGYGTVEIPPLASKGQVSYITARVDSDDNLILNLIMYGWKKPEEGEFRPFVIDGVAMWQQGDTIYNTDFIVNKVRGWVCTEEGVPGIWESFGQLGYAPTNSSGEEISSPSNSLAYYENELPSVGKSKLGKLILFAEDNSSDYDVYYCNRDIDRKGIISYSWNRLSQDYNDYLRLIYLEKDEEDDSIWLLNKLRNYVVTEDIGFRSKIKGSCILIGRVPDVSKNNQKLRIGGNDYLLKYDEERTINYNDFEKDSIIAIRFNPDISYINQNYLYVENIPVDYYLRKFLDLSNRLEQSVSELSNLLNSKVSVLTSNLSTINTNLLDRINSVDATLSDELDSLNQDLILARTGLVSDIESIQTELTTFKSAITQSLSESELELSGRITSTKSELQESISSINSDLLSKINFTNESLLKEIKKVSDKLNDLIDNKVELKGASIDGDLLVSGVVNSKELIFPTQSGSASGSIWLKTL